MTLMESLRVRVGLDSSDTSKDDEITAVKDISFSLMGNYCDRYFPLKADAEEVFTHIVGATIPLMRYPINSIASIIDDKGQDQTLYHSENETGTIRFDHHIAFHQATVTFSGGYDEDALPPDLLMAFYSVFDQEWALMEAGSSGGSSGDIQSVTVQDVGTVRYATSSSDASNAGEFLPDRAKSLLENYKRLQC